MFIDPMYIVLVLLPGFLISGGASLLVRSAFGKYSKVRSHNGYTGAQAARRLLDEEGIHDVNVVQTRGMLTDHYNPRSKQLALSDQVYSSTSVAACHEAGHAIQHANNYGPLGLRSTLVSMASIGSSLGYIVMVIGLLVAQSGVVMIGAILGCSVCSHLMNYLDTVFVPVPKGRPYASPGDPSQWVPRRREWNERRATLGCKDDHSQTPKGWP